MAELKNAKRCDVCKEIFDSSLYKDFGRLIIDGRIYEDFCPICRAHIQTKVLSLAASTEEKSLEYANKI